MNLDGQLKKKLFNIRGSSIYTVNILCFMLVSDALWEKGNTFIFILILGRDKKIVCVDKSVALKRDVNIVMLLKKRIASARSELDNLLLGDHEAIMYTLQENKGLLLACKDLHPNVMLKI